MPTVIKSIRTPETPPIAIFAPVLRPAPPVAELGVGDDVEALVAVGNNQLGALHSKDSNDGS